MKYCILFASPHADGNTAALIKPFSEALDAAGLIGEVISLYDKNILPCLGCRGCQQDHTAFACVQQDDMQAIAESILASDLIILASPIYSWYCTPPMKAALDRLVYGLNKYYGDIKGPSLWAGRSLALITTCGYRPEKGADLWEEGIRRYCKHSQLSYLGMLSERHLGYDTQFMDEEKALHAKDFAKELLERIK